MSDKQFLKMVAANWPFTRDWMTVEDLQKERERILKIAETLRENE